MEIARIGFEEKEKVRERRRPKVGAAPRSLASESQYGRKWAETVCRSDWIHCCGE
jgi:hypothetical protein